MNTITYKGRTLYEGPHNFFKLCTGTLPSFGIFRALKTDIDYFVSVGNAVGDLVLTAELFGSLVNGQTGKAESIHYTDTLTLPVYFVSARPVQTDINDNDNTLYEVTLADERILWPRKLMIRDYNTYAAERVDVGDGNGYMIWNTNAGATFTWAEILTDIETVLGVTITVGANFAWPTDYGPRNVVAKGRSAGDVLNELLYYCLGYLVPDHTVSPVQYYIHALGSAVTGELTTLQEYIDRGLLKEGGIVNLSTGARGSDIDVIFQQPDTHVVDGDGYERVYYKDATTIVDGVGTVLLPSQHVAVRAEGVVPTNDALLILIAADLGARYAASFDNAWYDIVFHGFPVFVLGETFHEITWQSNSRGATTRVRSFRPREDLRPVKNGLYNYSAFPIPLGALRYAKVLTLNWDGATEFIVSVTAHSCDADGTHEGDGTLLLKATDVAGAAPKGGIGVGIGFSDIVANDVIGYLPELVAEAGFDGTIIVHSGPDGAVLAGPTPAGHHPPSYWGTIETNLGGGSYTISGMPGGWDDTAHEVNGIADIGEHTIVRVFSAEDGTDPHFEYGGGGGGGGLIEDSFDFIEIWPALVITATDSPLSARIWIPNGPDFPPTVAGDWFLTEMGSTEAVSYDKIGDGSFTDEKLIPRLRDYSVAVEEIPAVEDWIHIRCLPGTFVYEDANTPLIPNGRINTFSGTAALPLPYTFTFEYEMVPGVVKRMYCTRTPSDAGDDFKVPLVGGSAGNSGYVKFRSGAWRVVLDECPPALSEMRVRFIPVMSCVWAWVETAQSLEGGDLEIVRPEGGEDDGWILTESDTESPFYGSLVHGDPQSIKLDTTTL